MKNSGILVIDLEKTCWDKSEKDKNISEIIQIGIVDLDFINLEIKRKKSFIIKTKNKISKYCENLTGINDEVIKKEGVEFEMAMNILERDWGIKNKKLVFWGNDNIDLEKEIINKKTNNMISKNVFNFANFYSYIYFLNNDRSFRNIGLKDALKNNNISFLGNQHNALDDAINTAILYKKIMKKIKIR